MCMGKRPPLNVGLTMVHIYGVIYFHGNLNCLCVHMQTIKSMFPRGTSPAARTSRLPLQINKHTFVELRPLLFFASGEERGPKGLDAEWGLEDPELYITPKI